MKSFKHHLRHFYGIYKDLLLKDNSGSPTKCEKDIWRYIIKYAYERLRELNK